MEDRDNFSDALDAAAKMGCARAVEDLLRSGIPVFYRDSETGIEVMEQPDGRRFEIRYISGEPRDRNFKIVREVAKRAA
ncbi:MAG: hypothetical protein ACRD45_16220 [Bryobacteraceae bacterium]